ncbi:MAG: hypothetical protein A3E38_00805 [Candidatus Moranbacteria bacterium RIFCSPHIGHO2_12_FULL_54_9]|nr:MAG: hypothetical protein A2878_03215 [Candidatus Moranbacteria bacterium RIFCSPHIGHO2_01_FULL_54_31]OGI26091.1 MAG: hypothetical protein A3E38_00805 [Candidatus Moranbacteria bacterium RIFCSPHIGHO2_12_FULL_54_9]
MDTQSPVEQPSKQERRALEIEQRRQTQASASRKQRLKKIIKRSAGALLVAGSIGTLVWYVATLPPLQEDEIISRNGIHWHSQLTLYVKGVKQDIPKDIGIGSVHKPVHTHDADGVIHLEFQGLVRRQDTTLGQFFKNWGKNPDDFGPLTAMAVNGQENTEFMNYHMRDTDKIEIRFDEAESAAQNR